MLPICSIISEKLIFSLSQENSIKNLPSIDLIFLARTLMGIPLLLLLLLSLILFGAILSFPLFDGLISSNSFSK